MNKELGQLEHIVNEFLQFARTPKPVRQPCDLSEVAVSVKTLCSKEASDHNVTIDIESPENLSEVRVDAPQLQQAILNVVLNAIQAMPAGGLIRIQLETGDDRVIVRVRDQGPGIPDDARTRLFEPFFTTRARGTGLGLALAKKLVEAQGGDIRVEDPPKSLGACFIITLPIEGGDHG